MKFLTKAHAFISTFLLISCCFTLTSLTESPNPKKDILGFWYYDSMENGIKNYVKSSTTGLGSTIQFKKSGKSSISFCTDICGCMRATYLGKWKWLNDSTIQAVYTQKKEASKGRKKRQSRDKKNYTFEIKSVGKEHLKMKRL